MQTVVRRLVSPYALVVLVAALAISCGDSTSPETPTPVVIPLTPSSTADLCALANGAAQLIAATGTTITSGVTDADCRVEDEQLIAATNPRSSAFFESVHVYLTEAAGQDVIFEVESDFDAQVSLFEVTGVVAGRNTLALRATNDDRLIVDQRPLVRSALEGGLEPTTYVVAISGFDADEVGDYQLKMSFAGPDSPAQPPAAGTIEVTTSTPAPSGGPYTVRVTPDKEKLIDPNDQVDYITLHPGAPYSVEVDLPDNCTVNGQNPLPNQTVVTGQVLAVNFDIVCQAGGGGGGGSTSMVSISGGGDGDGRVFSTPAGIQCTFRDGAASGQCSAAFATGSQVTLSARTTASPGETSLFSGWSGDCTGSSCSFVVDANKSATASWQQLFQIEVLGSGTGTGTVTDGAGIACTIAGGAATGACTDFLPAGTSVTLTATAGAASGFAGFSGACSGSSCTVSLGQPETVTAGFDALPQTLTVGTGGTGDGVIASSPAGINCTVTNGVGSGTCSAQFPGQSSVTLTATTTSSPGEQSNFLGWSGACSGATCSILMDQPRSATATYEQLFSVEILGAGAGSGVVSDGGSIQCTVTAGSTSGNCTAFLPVGSMTTLTGTAAAGDTFAGWSGSGCTTGSDDPCRLTVVAPVAITAEFIP